MYSQQEIKNTALKLGNAIDFRMHPNFRYVKKKDILESMRNGSILLAKNCSFGFQNRKPSLFSAHFQKRKFSSVLCYFLPDSYLSLYNCLIQRSKEVTAKYPLNPSPKIFKTVHSKQLLNTVGLSKGATKK